MNCPSCKHVVTPDRNYCGACGTPLARYCALCGFRNLAADRFCGGCGALLGAETSRSDRAASSDRGPGRLADASSPAPDSDLAELLAAAQEPAQSKGDDLSVRVSQDDIDSLFGD